MVSFRAAFINEMERMFRKKKIFIFTVVDIIATAFSLFMNKFLSIHQVALFNESTATNILSMFCLYILPIYVIMETMEVFSGQYGDKTITNVLTRPISRFKIYLSKLAAVTTFIAYHLVIVFIMTVLLNYSSYISMPMLLFSAIVSIIPMVALTSAMGLFSQVVKNGLFGMLLSIILLIGTYACQIFFTKVSAFLFTSYFDWYKMFIATSPRVIQIASTFILLCAYIVFTFGAGYYLFDKKEF